MSEQSAGTVSVGCPKVWRSDRVFSVLDGIMRDVDSMTIRALEGLDANAANQAAIDLIQNSFDLTAKFDQAAAINNQFALQKLKTARAAEVASFNADVDFRQKLTKQRNDLTLQLLDAQAKERQQSQSGASADEIGKTQKLEKSLQDQITGINSTLNSNPPSITDVPTTSTASTTINSTDQPQHATLDTMPAEFKKALTDLIKKPTFPPAIAMDNVIDLLHQRIAREFAVIYDDLMRDGDRYDVYLVQFDTSINPKLDTHDRGVRVQLTLPSCAQQDYPLAYELYPSAAAYNIMQGFDQTSHIGITGIVQTIFGFGLQASFKRDHSSLRSGLSQSIYASGFGAGQNTFGWDFAPAPYESRLAPGLRTTYAIMRVPKGCQGPLRTVLKVDWPMRDRRYPGWNPAHWFRSDKKKPAQWGPWIDVPQDHPLRLTHVSYVPADAGEKGTGDISAQKTAPASGNAAAADSGPGGGGAVPATSRPAVIQVRFRNPIDPNLIVTANDQILRRVRDVRGRGLYSDTTTALHLAGNKAETDTLSSSRFGLLESDTLGEDTWFQADSRTILLNVGRKTAGTDHFPVIRIIDPSSGGGGSELTTLAREADDVRIGEWFFTQPDKLTSSSFQPLFAKPYDPGPFHVFIQKVIRSNDQLSTLELRLVSYATTRGTHRPIYLHDQAQVVLEADVNNDEERFILPESVDRRRPAIEQAFQLRPNWPMECRQDRGALVCDVPLESMRLFCGAADKKANAKVLSEHPNGLTLGCLANFKVWIDEAPYYGRAGIWGDADLSLEPPAPPRAPTPAPAPTPTPTPTRTRRHSYEQYPAFQRHNSADPASYSNVVFTWGQAQPAQAQAPSNAAPATNAGIAQQRKERSLDDLQLSDQDLIARGNYEITMRERGNGNDYEWLVELEIIDYLSTQEYEIPEFLRMEKNVERHYFRVKHPLQPGQQAETTADTEKKAENDEATRRAVHNRFFSVPANEACSKQGDPQLPFEVCPWRHRIQFTVPFALYSFLPETLHLQRKDRPDSRIELPNLRSQLIPHEVKVLELEKNIYQFQGDHLKAVTAVRLTSLDAAGKPTVQLLRPLATSANAVDVVVDEKKCKDVPCTVQLGIGGEGFPDTFIDLTKTDENGKEVPQTLPDIVPAKPKPAAAQPPPAQGRSQTPPAAPHAPQTPPGQTPPASKTPPATQTPSAQTPPASKTPPVAPQATQTPPAQTPQTSKTPPPAKTPGTKKQQKTG